MDRYFSKMYRGLLVQQTERGWVIPQLPNWSNGPVSQGPYATYQIACHIIDRVLEEQDRGLQKSQSTNTPRESMQHSYTDSSSVQYKSIWEFLLFHFLALIILVSGFFGVISLLGRHPSSAIIYFAIALGTYLFAKRIED
nr:MAG: hypothetical protein [Caudoviricetes sp.]